ncbi:MAG: epimerase [Chloroflexus sp.]|uniref:NAD-dependent epimerase/dehydratase family protein n=1 Tax=Chloroflexus sp. TaxID=1904827 RepID=UPI0021DDA1EA|nr:NAD-dependent epimerase/dehydratase family protein [Chloroflexus sp.]GIV89673.1 MAG: epimerase [Chloroflexus sp.]
MTNYLIAGAAGYIGSRLAARLLAAGHHVRGLVYSAEDPVVERLASLGMAVWIGDLTRPETIDGITDEIEVVYNLTNRMPIDGSTLLRSLYVDGNQHLIAMSVRARTVRAYVWASNAAPYGDHGENWVDEDSPIAPSYPLGTILATAEQIILQAVRAYRFPAIILRMATVYGPDRDPLEAIASGQLTIYGNGRNFIPHIHIDDALEVLIRTVEMGQIGAIYNVSEDEPLRLIEIVSEVRRRLGMLPPRTFDPQVGLRAGLDRSVIGALTSSVRMSNARMRHDLGIELRYPSLRYWIDERLPLELAVGV